MSKHKGYEVSLKNKAAEYNVNHNIHDADFIFEFLMENPCFLSKEDAINYYFMDGQESAKKLAQYIDGFHYENESLDLLEFASGYGCVTRHLNNVLNNINVTSCDIHNEAIDFLASKLNVSTILSHSIPESFATEEKYDVIFALSFFSHMPKSTWSRWLLSLTNQVNNGGYLIFTTQGFESRKFFGEPVLDDEGFWFKSESEQKDLGTDEYGQTIVSKDYVLNVIKQLPRIKLIEYVEAGWWEHQDVYIIKVRD